MIIPIGKVPIFIPTHTYSSGGGGSATLLELLVVFYVVCTFVSAALGLAAMCMPLSKGDIKEGAIAFFLCWIRPLLIVRRIYLNIISKE